MADIDKLSKLSGDKQTGQAPRLNVNQVKLNGAKGELVFEHATKGLIEINGKKTYQKESLGNQTEVIFLKIRRKLVQFRKGQKSLSTSEHNHPGQKVMLYGDKPEKGVASELREKYPLLRTQQVVYALLNGEIVRLFVKGASLGSDSKAKEVTDFYSYVSSFTGNEHFFLCKTVLTAVEEQGDLGSYYVLDFKKGDKITEQEQNDVEKAMIQVADYCKESDDYYQKFFENNTLPKDEKEEVPVIEYPESDYEDEVPF